MEKSKVPMANTRSIMAKKYKINDGSTNYVETATLLEPANNSASNQNELEEIKEVSFQLSQIKKKHDEAKKLGNQKQEDLEKMRKEIEALNNQGLTGEGENFYVQSRIESLQEQLADVKYKTDEEMYTRNSYQHMQDRLKKDFIAAKIASTENEASLKNKSAILEKELAKQSKVKEDRLQSKNIFEALMENISK